MWLTSKRSGWYQDFTTAVQYYNNNKSDNRYIKEDQDRKRLGLIQFLNHATITLMRKMVYEKATRFIHLRGIS